jgi:hypothetical protein
VSDIATLPPAGRRTCPLSRLAPADLTRRQGEIRTAIARARSAYPLAAANLQHWLNSSGARRDVLLSEFNFLSNDSGLPQFLRSKHRPVIARGHQTGFDDVPAGALGIEGRLRLPRSNPQSLIPGQELALDWQDSVRADMRRRDSRGRPTTAPSLERDLSIALGGYIVHSRVTVRAQPAIRTSAGTRQVIEVVSWKVQICDRYDWIVGSVLGQCISAEAPILIPSGIAVPPVPQGAGEVRRYFGHTVIMFNDQWMAEVEHSGGARAYVIYSEVFDAPAHVRAEFESINGTVRP